MQLAPRCPILPVRLLAVLPAMFQRFREHEAPLWLDLCSGLEMPLVPTIDGPPVLKGSFGVDRKVHLPEIHRSPSSHSLSWIFALNPKCVMFVLPMLCCPDFLQLPALGSRSLGGREMCLARFSEKLVLRIWGLQKFGTDFLFFVRLSIQGTTTKSILFWGLQREGA